MPLRLLYVLTSMGVGGAETQVLALSEAMRRRGWTVGVLALAGGPLESAFPDGVSTQSLGLQLGRVTPRLVTRVCAAVRRWRPDVVHSHTLPANLISRVARPLSRVPVLVTSCHAMEAGGRRRLVAYRLTDRLADWTTNVSEAARRAYIAGGAARPDRIGVLPNGIDVTRFRPGPDARRRTRAALGVPPAAFLWLAVGRVDAGKDYPGMLDGFARSLADGADGYLRIAGVGPDLSAVGRAVSERGLGQRVALLGLRGDVPDLLRACDGYVMSSRHEGLPMVLLEAGASGVPMVVTDAGGNREIVEDGVSGYVVPPADPRALGAAMSRLALAAPNARARMGAAARGHVAEAFALETVADRWDDLYRRLLRGAPPQADEHVRPETEGG